MAYETVVDMVKEEMEKFGLKGVGYIGKHIVGNGKDAHLTIKVLVKIPKLRLFGKWYGVLQKESQSFIK